MPQLTPNYSFNLPLVDSSTDSDLWGQYLNSNWSSLDTTLKTVQNSTELPVGSIYANISNSTNPATLLGYGTWTALAGVGIVGVGTGTDSNGATQTFTAGTQVGEYVHTLVKAELPVTAYQDSGHVHGPGGGESYFITSGTGIDLNNAGGAAFAIPSTTASATANITNPTGGGAHNNVMPVIGAYLWYRSA